VLIGDVQARLAGAGPGERVPTIPQTLTEQLDQDLLRKAAALEALRRDRARMDEERRARAGLPAAASAVPAVPADRRMIVVRKPEGSVNPADCAARWFGT
jgi:hypothetical protein